jgi:hypothetical protein
MIDVGLCAVTDAEIIDDETEDNIAGVLVSKQVGGVWTL